MVPAMDPLLTGTEVLPVTTPIFQLRPHPRFTQGLSALTLGLRFSHHRVQILAT